LIEYQIENLKLFVLIEISLLETLFDEKNIEYVNISLKSDDPFLEIILMIYLIEILLSLQGIALYLKLIMSIEKRYEN
jgi:hypothetical protein